MKYYCDKMNVLIIKKQYFMIGVNFTEEMVFKWNSWRFEGYGRDFSIPMEFTATFSTLLYFSTFDFTAFIILQLKLLSSF